jgi:hypothetical protein
MKALLILVLGLGLSCATVGPVVKTTALDCAKAVSPDILPAVETALVAQDYLLELGGLAAKFGLCVVNKAVTFIMSEAVNDQHFASGDVNAHLKVMHGQDWLLSHPTP